MILTPHQPLSAHEREQQRVAYIAAVDAMARELRAAVPVLNATTMEVENLIARQAALEARIAVLERPLRQRVRESVQWLVAGGW